MALALPAYVGELVGFKKPDHIPPLMTERTELVTKFWRDCTQAAYMMAVYADRGPSVFKLGYTAKEREALQDAQDNPDQNKGSTLGQVDTAAKRRYGKPLGKLGQPLDKALMQSDTALVLQGENGRLPAGDRLRRWQPGFTGGHAVAVLPLGDGTSWWMDPLAPGSYAGERVSNTKILSWAWGRDYARVGGVSGGGGDGGPPPGTQVKTLGGWNNLILYDEGHVLTAADVDDIMQKLTDAGYFQSGIAGLNNGPAQEIVRGILMMHVGEPWDKALQGRLQTQFGQASELAGTSFDPTGGVATGVLGFLGNLTDPRKWAYFLALAAGGALVLVGGYFVLRGASAA